MSAIGWVLWSGTLACVAVATVCALLQSRWPALVKTGEAATTVGAVISFAGLAYRSFEAGHLPVSGTFENTYVATAFLLALGAVALRRDWSGRDAWRLVVPWGVLLLLWGVRYGTAPTPLAAAGRSPWVEVHVLFAWLAHALLLWGSSLGIYRLVQRKNGDRPDAEEKLLLLITAAGFALLTIMICAGSWYLFILYAKFWRWEIVGACALVAWVGYGLVIHGRLQHGVKGRAFDVGVVAMLVPLLLLFWIWSVYPDTYHFFDVALVRR